MRALTLLDTTPTAQELRDSIMDAAGWSSEDKFRKFYDNQSLRMLKLCGHMGLKGLPPSAYVSIRFTAFKTENSDSRALSQVTSSLLTNDC